MDVRGFVQWWKQQDREDLDDMLRRLHELGDTADGEICRLRAEARLDACLRRSGCSREACNAAHHASAAVLDACARTGLLLEDRTGATRLARAAAEIGRGLVAAPESEFLAELLRPFRPTLDSVA